MTIKMIKLDLASVKKWVLKNPITFECLLIFLSCVFVYLANDQSSASGDTWSNSQLAFNWLFNNTLNFDDFRAVFSNRHLPHSLAEAPNGHLTSTYPIGPVIVTFPLYVIFSAYLRLIDWLHQFSSYLDIPGVSLGSDIPSITDSEFQSYRASFSKLAATLSTSLSVVIFYLAVRLKFNIFIALITTFIFAFATGTWTVSSQHMLQHGISNLELASIMLCLLKVHRSEGKNRKILLLTAGFFCGLLPATRPPCLLFVMAIVFYSLFTYRRDAVFFLVGCLSFLLGGIWNTYYFGFSFKTLIYGGYINHAKGNFGLSSYIFSLDQFLKSF
ncbi:MAG: hypothetical protein HC769_32235 [Cyanobacteria bacterium CRU_2_1]|nr:hypothetical protein [Cyanobacteria bacterium CRU_2_1]